MNVIQHSLRPSRRNVAITIAAAAALLVSACGGGGGDTSSSGSTSFAAGRIAGFGSVIVNGIRFDDRAADVRDDDGVAHPRGDLALGMIVDIDGGPIVTDTLTGTSSSNATAILFGSQIKGPVQAVAPVSGRLTVLGQAVTVDAATSFSGFANGLASVAIGNLVEVFALFDAASSTYRATRIELKSTLAEFKLQGPVIALNASSKSFTIGGEMIDFSGLAPNRLPALANGVVVRVRAAPVASGSTLVATGVTSPVRAIADHSSTEVEGLVNGFVSLASFKVNGLSVDASSSGVTFRNGLASDVANGRRVEVEGITQGGLLVATRVDVKRADGRDIETELHGMVDAVAAGGQSFTLRGQTVTFDAQTRFDDGNAAALAVGVQLEVRGALDATGTHVVAARIEFGH